MLSQKVRTYSISHQIGLLIGKDENLFFKLINIIFSYFPLHNYINLYNLKDIHMSRSKSSHYGTQCALLRAIGYKRLWRSVHLVSANTKYIAHSTLLPQFMIQSQPHLIKHQQSTDHVTTKRMNLWSCHPIFALIVRQKQWVSLLLFASPLCLIDGSHDEWEQANPENIMKEMFFDL